MNMVTISADVPNQMVKWADAMIKKGLYKSRSEVVRALFREHMEDKNDAYYMSLPSLRKVWENEDDAYWESVLTEEEKKKWLKK